MKPGATPMVQYTLCPIIQKQQTRLTPQPLSLSLISQFKQPLKRPIELICSSCDPRWSLFSLQYKERWGEEHQQWQQSNTEGGPGGKRRWKRRGVNDTKMETENGEESYKQASQKRLHEIKRKGRRLKKKDWGMRCEIRKQRRERISQED